MKKKLLLAWATLTLLACTTADAQTRGGGASSVPSMPARIVPVRATSIARASGVSAPPPASGVQALRQFSRLIQIAPNGRVTSGAVSVANSTDFSDENGVPGLGFDYVHLAAVSGNFRNNPPSFERSARHERNFLTPIFFGGFPYYSDSLDYQPVQQQPQIIVIQQPAPAVTVQLAAPVLQETTTDAAIPAPSPAPVHEVGEFILVRRDGRVLFASAFSVIGVQLQYVTPEGIRRTLRLAELDAAATQDMNEARGTTLQFIN